MDRGGPSIATAIAGAPAGALDPSPSAEAWRANLAILGAALAVVAWAAAGPAPGLLRLAVPAGVLVAAAVLLLRDRVPAFLALALWSFAAAPLARRLIDLRAGWLDANPVMLAPYMATMLAALAIPVLLGRRPLPGRPAFLVLLLAVLWGLLLAVGQGRLISGGIDALRWATPPLLAALLAASGAPAERLRAHVEVFLVLALLLCSAYGVWQFVVAPPWDGFWMVQSEMNSIGRPEPYEVRVFSTWNSPGSFSFLLLAGLLLLAGRRGWLSLAALAAGAVALALTLVRSTWIGAVLGLAVVAAADRGGARRRLLALGLGLVAALPLAALDPQVQDLLTDRVRSLVSVGSDESAFDRLTAYRSLIAELEENPWGQGLAISGAYAEADGGRPRVIDGGLIEVSLALGVVGGTAYLAAVAALALTALARARAQPGSAGLVALVLAYALLFASGTTTVGEIGLFLWVAIGLLLAGPARPGEAA